MSIGGGLQSIHTFKKILSIGFEFETNDLAKLSLHGNKRTLINSDATLRTLEEKLEQGSATEIDDNYISFRIPIGVDVNKIEKEDENIDLEAMDEEERAYWEEFQQQRESDILAKKENESYLDYFNENRKSDNKKKLVKFQITNDLGDTPFGFMLKGYCEELTIPKNDMFTFKTRSGRELDIKFSEKIATNDVCETFSNIEFVITYYSPKRDNPNIILEKFVDACSRIVDHFGDVKPIKGSLLINDGRSEPSTVGYLDDKRHLYHKPGTNLFYMDTYDSFSEPGKEKIKTLGHAIFIPQMTFRCKADDAISIMKEIFERDKGFKRGKSISHLQIERYDELVFLEEVVDDLFINYNKHSRTKININDTEIGRVLKTYLFLIYKKLYMFILNHISIFNESKYLKDTLIFASRHSNFELFERVREILKEHYNITDDEKLLDIICNPITTISIYEEMLEKKDKEDYEKGKYKYSKDAHKLVLRDSETNFGNPLFSLRSYFKYMLKESVDWLKVKKYDVYSTTFPIKDDTILLENRFFRYEIGLYLRNMLSPDMPNDAVSVNDMLKIVNKFYGEKIRQMITLKKHPSKNKLTRKSKEESAISFGKLRRKVKSIYKNRENKEEEGEKEDEVEEGEPEVNEIEPEIKQPEVKVPEVKEGEQEVKPEEKRTPSLTQRSSTRRATPNGAVRNRSARLTPILTHG